MTCTECHSPCEALGTEPFVIYICCNCGRVIEPQKATFADLDKEEEREGLYR